MTNTLWTVSKLWEAHHCARENKHFHTVSTLTVSVVSRWCFSSNSNSTLFWTDPWLTPVRAVPVASGLWRGVHLVRAGQEVKALQCLLCVRVLTGVHTGGGRRRRGLLSQDLGKTISRAVINNIEWGNFSLNLCECRRVRADLFSYRPGFHISPVPPLTILFLIFVTELGCCVLNELEGLEYSASFRELSFPVGQQVFRHYCAVAPPMWNC